ncbi:MAG: sugar-binding protein, partial [Micropruina sp.]|uniref:sugar-binding protein n=1 Tax=Micropruina sp. TaxID=2737536 RepID=UPI0039E518BF
WPSGPSAAAPPAAPPAVAAPAVAAPAVAAPAVAAPASGTKWVVLASVAAVLVVAVFFGWPYLFPGPAPVPTESSNPTLTAAPTSATPTPSRSTASLPPVRAVDALKALRGSVTIDGNTDDWQWQLVSRANHQIAGNTKATGDIYLMWDDQALYLLALVEDADPRPPDPSQPSRVFRGDSVILELGTDKSRLSPSDLARPTDAYYMVGLPADARSAPVRAILGPNAKGTSFETARDASTLQAAITLTRTGYVVEAKIPWRTTRLNGVRAGATLAANVQVSERKADSFANLGMRSTNPQRTADVRAHPAYWQALELQP